MARVWQRVYGNPARIAKALRRKPKDTRVKNGGHGHRTVNAPKRAW